MNYIQKKQPPSSIEFMPKPKIEFGGEKVDTIVLYDGTSIGLLDPTFDYRFDVSREPYGDDHIYSLIKTAKRFFIPNTEYDTQMAEYLRVKNEYEYYCKVIDAHNAKVKEEKTLLIERAEFERLKLKFESKQ